jgi:hypothetical protein
MSDKVLDKWRDRAQAVREPLSNFSLPTHAFLGEAVDVTAFARNYWSAEEDGQGKQVRPGLESVNNSKTTRLDPKRVEELDELQQAAHRAQFHYKMAVNGSGADIMERAGATLAELTAILEYYYDDGEDTVEDVQLERLSDEHTQPTSHDAMALALDDYAAMAEPIRGEIDGLADFSAPTIDTARELAKSLRQRSAPTVKNSAADKALRLRNQVWTLLHQRIREVRRAARIVFRNHPETLRMVTSNYQRRKRAEYLRRQRNKKSDPGTPPPPPPAAIN